ncbi:MAG: sulfite exporter TauE/SafE family protein [Clostridia bacterium]|nr:sulfite exporter TauE/SafE family protein [Clostridia bacterium]
MGGGTILVLVLSNFLNINQHMAQATNLLYFIPTSIAAICVYWKNGNVDKKVALKMIPCGIIFGFIGSYVATLIESKMLKKYFGIFLLIIGVYEMYITVKNKIKEKNRKD